MKPKLPERVRIVEVGPRDGLQNEPRAVPTAVKLQFIQALANAGLDNIEATSFVHPHAVPQLADAAEVARLLPPLDGVTYSALVPNEKGLDRALGTHIRRIAVFTAASETFVQRNTNMSIEESLLAFAPVIRRARDAGLTARGYISTCFVCPYEGAISRERVYEVALRLLALGVDEIAVSDTIGAAAPTDIDHTVGFLLERLPANQLALHLHDTYGTALTNVLAALHLGITTFDASAGGLGGCPFAPGAAGNLATEDLVYMLERMGIATGVSLPRLVEATDIIASHLGGTLPSRQWRRLRGSRDAGAQ